ncbi:putative GTP-binding protein EngB [Tolypocladium ophioglossoides CBS 100239]|uniref:Putative GTP-binding protein EngB n=1 Tax=Tolypocladium ophioglossoides (strain CBS 100239) TaxID=1163406 RepID=A0A0L0N3V8_TOLOC|nr:putative GTP-binding protein EngB [Tolypocladium ophioglossoides CBS 100239]
MKLIYKASINDKTGRQTLKSPGNKASPPAIDRKTAIQQALHDVAPDKRSLASNKVIRHGLDRPLTTKATREEARQLAAAERFFAHACQFLYSAEALRHHAINDHAPEVVVLGASNVGKSSFLNALVGQPGAARVSQRPGRTTLMNAYGVGPRPKIARELVRKGEPPPRHSLVLVDTPGYGFRSQASWGSSILAYLEARRMLRGAVLLLSSEKRLLPEDKWLLRVLAESNTRTLVVLTKADKGRNDWPARCSDMAETLLEELQRLDKDVGGGWRAGEGATADVYITSAGMDSTGKLGNGGGMGGVRAAILEMAGFTLQDKVNKKAEAVTYSGPIVSFDDIQWK